MTVQDVLESWNESVIPKDELEIEAYLIVKNSLEKQTPKEAIEKEGRHSFSGKLMYVIARCPSCRNEINSSTNVYCSSCGQLIDVKKYFDGISDIV